ncbi:MAG: HlyD family efflux transporter periplasmic adaptor subunit [Rhodanobacteraceae bacterium]|jgi:HlyD family secretion protein|nr:HlyD family efflux transporter periplasmic adaptor subunit [Rhodanobacteraceae bacterium]
MPDVPVSEPRRRRLVVPAVAALVLVAGAVLAWRHYHAWPDGLILANGRIEGDRYVAAAKVAGRVHEVRVREGQAVQAGEVLATLEDDQVRAKVDQARQAVAALEARLKAAQAALEVAEQEVPLAVASAEAGLANARAVLGKAQAAEDQAARDVERMRALEQEGSIERHRREEAELLLAARRADRVSAGAGVAVAERALANARLGPARIGAKRDEVAALAAELARARAGLDEVDSVARDLAVRAPVAGIVTTRIAEPGVVMAAGAPLLELVDLDHLYLTAFVPAIEIGKLKRGLPARVHVDAFPDRAFAATLDTIASRAEFTPKEVQTRDERVKQVYRTKLYLDANPDHVLTPGIPADAVIRCDSTVPWRAPNW